jgi:hypothetical protein
MENESNPLRRQDLIWREVDREVVILSSDNKRMHVLNDVGSRIWTLLDGEHRKEDILRVIFHEYEATENEMETDISEYLSELRQLNLLE